MPALSDIHRPILVLAGLCGALGVGLAAAASHRGGADLGIAANFLQLHAPALIGVSFLAGNRVALAAGYVLVVGLVLFAGDLVARTFLAAPFFPLAAPIGGSGLILGWVLLAVSAFIGWHTPRAR